MKITEEEAKAKLEQVGLPIHGTHDELIARLEANGLMNKEYKPRDEGVFKDSYKPNLENVKTVDVIIEQPKRGRPKVK